MIDPVLSNLGLWVRESRNGCWLKIVAVVSNSTDFAKVIESMMVIFSLYEIIRICLVRLINYTIFVR